MLSLLSVPTTVLRFPIDQSLKKGDVVQLFNENGSIYLKKSDGQAPIGILNRKIRIVNKKNRTVKRRIGEVVFSRCILQTDNYDPQQSYQLGYKLFIDQDGRFTTKQPSNTSPSIGWITNCPTADNQLLQLMWL